jgi:hypothetical protein
MHDLSLCQLRIGKNEEALSHSTEAISIALHAQSSSAGLEREQVEDFLICATMNVGLAQFLLEDCAEAMKTLKEASALVTNGHRLQHWVQCITGTIALQLAKTSVTPIQLLASANGAFQSVLDDAEVEGAEAGGSVGHVVALLGLSECRLLEEEFKIDVGEDSKDRETHALLVKKALDLSAPALDGTIGDTRCYQPPAARVPGCVAGSLRVASAVYERGLGEPILAEGLLNNAVDTMARWHADPATAGEGSAEGSAELWLPSTGTIQHELVLSMCHRADLLARLEWNGQTREKEADLILKRVQEMQAECEHPLPLATPGGRYIGSWYFDCLQQRREE